MALLPFLIAHRSNRFDGASQSLHHLVRFRDLLRRADQAQVGNPDVVGELAEDLAAEARQVQAASGPAAGRTRDLINVLTRQTRTVVNQVGAPRALTEPSVRDALREAFPTANRAVWSAEQDVRHEHAAAQGAQATACTVSVALLFGVALAFARRYVKALQRALTEAEDAKGRLTEKVERLQALSEELQNLTTQNSEYKGQLAKALEEAENATELLQHASFRFEELFQGLPVACVSVGQDGTVYDWNRAATALFGHPSSSVYLQNVITVLPVDKDVESIRQAIERAAQGEYVREVEWTAKTGTPRTVDVLSQAFPIKSMNGTVNGVLLSCADQTERKQSTRMLEEQIRTIQEMNATLDAHRIELQLANERLEALATTDGLTGLKNHRTFQQLLKEHFDRAQGRYKPLGLLLLDVDMFKLFNDDFGHQAGDEILTLVARVLELNSRPGDIVARYGGEEFVVILPESTEPEAFAAAERLRKALESQEWPYRQVTASIGVAILEKSVHDPSELVAQADLALYASKEGGRNRVTAFSALQPKVA